MLVLVLVIGFSGCNIKVTETEVVCNTPYIRYMDTCCLDENADGVCDKHEPEPPRDLESDIVGSPFGELPPEPEPETPPPEPEPEPTPDEGGEGEDDTGTEDADTGNETEP